MALRCPPPHDGSAGRLRPSAIGNCTAAKATRRHEALNCGIVGLPNVGKSTLFNALTQGRHRRRRTIPFCTIEPNVGIVAVPDPRLDAARRRSSSRSASCPAAVEFVDIAGLVAGASQGRRPGQPVPRQHPRDRCHRRTCVRCFEDGNVDARRRHGRSDRATSR
jgi:hypothetical protein